MLSCACVFVFFQAEDGIRDLVRSRGLGDVYKRQLHGTMRMISRAELLRIQWTPKLYLHNTPHCITAYLGALMGATYVHEAMAHPKACLLYTSDAADERPSVDLGGRRIIKKKKE